MVSVMGWQWHRPILTSALALALVLLLLQQSNGWIVQAQKQKQGWADAMSKGRFGSMSLNAVVCADQQACPVTRPSLLHPWLQLGAMENTIGVAYLKCNPPDQVPVLMHLVRLQALILLSPSSLP
ncbi:hypothetical protein V8C42DRAFT_284064 [Trichoderma barbatum]